jgi:small-conductance mechanosensitive channel
MGLSLFLLSFTLNAADINATILNGDIKVYQRLLDTLSKNRVVNDEINLQKTLLSKLIDASKKEHFRAKNLSVAKNQTQYINLFTYYIEILNSVNSVEKSLLADQAKKETLDEQLGDSEKNNLTTELFYTFYTKKSQNEALLLEEEKSLLPKIQELLITSLHTIEFDKKEIEKQSLFLSKKIQNLKQTIENLKIKKERYTLLDEKKLLSTTLEQISKNQTQLEMLYKKELNILFLKFSMGLKEHNKNIIKQHNALLEFTKNNISSQKDFLNGLDNLLSSMEEAFLGTVERLKVQGLEEFEVEMKSVWEMLNETLFVINKTPISTLKLLLSLFILIAGFVLGNLYKRYIKSLSLKNKIMSASTHTLLANMGSYAIFLITFFIVLKVMGIDLSSIALVAGALSVGIGFGLQNVISNFVSGIILMVERSVKIGDYIELDENLRGHVVDIKMRSITVNTNSNIDIIVPNQDLIQNRVINWTMNDKIRRFEIPFGVAYGTDPQKVISVILEAVHNSGFEDLYNTSERHTRVIMTGMGNSSVDFELFVWIKGKEILFPKRTTSRFLVLIYNTLYENGIEIPFPQQDLHIRSVDVALPIQVTKDIE